MRNAAGNPLRTIFRGATGLFTTATTVYRPRVSRGLVLQVSLLLFVRVTLELIPLPLASLLGETVVSLVLNVFQTSIGLAALATWWESDGWFGSIGRRLFAPSDSSFVKLYAALVLVFGPAFALVESAVVVFESMRIARDLEDRMNRVPASTESNPWKRIIVISSIIIYSSLIGIAFFAHHLNGGQLHLPSMILGFAILYFVVAYIAEDSNIMEGALLAAYSVVLLIVGVVEEIDSKNSSAITIFSRGLGAPKGEHRALVLIFSSAGALLSLPRVPELLRVVLFSAEAAEARAQAQQSRAELRPAPMLLAPMQTMTVAVPPLGLASQGVVPTSDVISPQGTWRTTWQTSISTAISVIVVTFRVLVWSGALVSGEYYPLLSRSAQLIMTLVVYCLFLKMESSDNEEKQRHRAAVAAQHSKIHKH